jgi:NarL family two-component system response regulator LiaR
MDLVMDGMDGIEATKQICAKLNDPKITSDFNVRLCF